MYLKYRWSNRNPNFLIAKEFTIHTPLCATSARNNLRHWSQNLTSDCDLKDLRLTAFRPKDNPHIFFSPSPFSPGWKPISRQRVITGARYSRAQIVICWSVEARGNNSINRAWMCRVEEVLTGPPTGWTLRSKEDRESRVDQLIPTQDWSTTETVMWVRRASLEVAGGKLTDNFK